MDKSQRILINAFSQYFRTIVCTVLTLYSTRIILNTLGESDFGVYALIGSIVTMLSFVTTSLSASTQRFVSYSWGKNDVGEIRTLFGSAFVMHLIIGVVLAVVLLSFESYLIFSFLNIPDGRIDAACFVFRMVVIILVLTFLTAPVKALFIARENIVFSSMIDVIDGVIKLVGAIGLTWVTIDVLKAYALLMTFISLFAFSAYVVYAFLKYEEFRISPSDVSFQCIRRLLGFAVWNVYAVGSTVIRTQGIAVVINKACDTLVNAAYGVSLQMSGAVNSVAASIVNAINPQLMKAEGRNDRDSMLKYATLESRYSFLVLSTVLIPVMVEMQGVLNFWLGKCPPYSAEFCTLLLASVIFDQSTIGLTSANQAIGRIRNYSLLISTIRLTILPFAWLCVKSDLSVSSVMWVYLAVEALCGAIRVPFLKYTAGLNVTDYCRKVYLDSLVPIACNVAICYTVTNLSDFKGRFLLTELSGLLLTLFAIYKFTLDNDERTWIDGMLRRIFTKKHVQP